MLAMYRKTRIEIICCNNGGENVHWQVNDCKCTFSCACVVSHLPILVFFDQYLTF